MIGGGKYHFVYITGACHTGNEITTAFIHIVDEIFMFSLKFISKPQLANMMYLKGGL